MEKAGSFTGRSNGNGNDDDVNSKPECPETVELSEEKDQNINDSSSSTDLPISISQVSEEIDVFIKTLSKEDRNDKPSPIELPDFVDTFVKLVESVIAKYDSGENSLKAGKNSEEDSEFFEAVSRISKLTDVLDNNRATAVLQRAMSFLEEELRSILEDSRASSDSDQKALKAKQSSFKSEISHDSEAESTGEEDFPAYSPEMISNLNRIATAMISAGYETECCQVYSVARRHAFKLALNELGFENISIDEVLKMNWESLEGDIATWIKAFKHCTTALFSGESKLCDSVFSNYPSISRSLFSNLARAVVINFLNFAEAVSMTKPSAEKLFKFLDMYETLRDLVPAIDGANSYSDDIVKELNLEITAAASRLGEAAACIFCDLENSIKGDTERTPVPSGAVHPLTRYTMNYLKYACEYKDTLEQVFQQHHHDKIEDSTETSPFSSQLMTVMDLLDKSLDAKSKLYKDASLRYIFLMNNGRYILQKIKGSTEINEIMGDTWCRKRSSDLRQYHKNYRTETWGKLLGCLSHEGLQVHGKVVKPVLKERFKSFNALFEEIHKTQSAWVVSDEQLQSELRVSISAVVIPAYRSFLGRFSQYLDAGRQTDKYVKYQPDDIETSIDELFDGNPASMVRRRT